MRVEDCFLLGSIRKPHGILGEVKAFFDVDDIEAYTEKESVYILQGSKLTPFHILNFRPVAANIAVLQLKGISDRNHAETLAGAEMYLPLSELPELEEGQFYYHDIIGFQVIDATHGPLGHVARIVEMPGHDLIEMAYNDRVVLIPINGDIVTRADHAGRALHTALPEGLLEIYMTPDKEPAPPRQPRSPRRKPIRKPTKPGSEGQAPA